MWQVRIHHNHPLGERVSRKSRELLQTIWLMDLGQISRYGSRFQFVAAAESRKSR